MLTRLGDSVAQFADKTKSLAVEAFEALDAPDLDPNVVNSPELFEGGRPNGSPSTSPKLLQQLVVALTGHWSDDPDYIVEKSKALVTQIDMLRELAATGLSDHHQKETATTGSFLELVDSLLLSRPDNATSSTLLEALEQEQLDHARTKTRLAAEIKLRETQAKEFDQQVKECGARLVTEREEFNNKLVLANEKIQALLEEQKLQKPLKNSNDSPHMVDVRVMRSAFVSLCQNMGNVPIRNSVLGIIGQIIGLSVEEMHAVERGSPGLASEFVQFLSEEVDGGESSNEAFSNN